MNQTIDNLKPPVLFFLFGAIPATIMFMIYMHQREQLDWPALQAEITATDTDIRSTKPVNIWLDYTYEVDGVTYEGSGMAPDPYNMDEYFYSTDGYLRREAIDWWNQQNQVKVIYNPEEPMDSSTFPFINTGWLVGAIIFGLFGLLGLVSVITTLTGLNGDRKNMMLTREQHNQVTNELLKRRKGRN